MKDVNKTKPVGKFSKTKSQTNKDNKKLKRRKPIAIKTPKSLIGIVSKTKIQT